MYAISHTTHTLNSLSNTATAKVEACVKALKKPFKGGMVYRRVIKNEVWSFFPTYEEAKAHQAMLFLYGSQA